MTWGIYIHVPFCLRKCPYCDFYSIEDLSLLSSWKDALIRETAMRAESVPGAVFDTVYLGGGTPSVPKPSEMEQILQAAHRSFSILPDAEITMEANPGTITEESLAEYRSAGVNRINMGVQSFNDDNLAFLGRIHSAGQAAEALHAAKRAGFDNIGLDLIYGLPGQNKKSWQKDLTAAAAFSPSHISCYMLTFEPGTKMAADKEAGRFEPLSEDRVSAMFIQASKFLSGLGFEHYEISNFAASKAARSGHNRKYWQNVPYIGLGPAAHSYVEPERSWNFRSVEDYIEAIADNRLPTEGAEHLTPSQMMIEAIYLGLRQAEGIDIFAFEKRP
ncbi:MAG: radical SAM family heme chaperone HemW, partial [Desulfobacterales bacterium]|nr:radical SAM family heme chaperone HemW [Desulfobacterales bacterium]